MKCKHCKKKIDDAHGRMYCNRRCFEKDYFSRPDNKIKTAQWSYRHKIKKTFNLTKEEYDKITEICSVVGCNWIHHVELHHKDHDKNNNDKSNFAALCPNHHRLLHLKGISLKELSKY